MRAGYQQRKRYSLLKLPPFIIFHLSRFTKNNFYMEKNPTIVNFPIKDLDLSHLLADTLPSDEALQSAAVAELRDLCKRAGGDIEAEAGSCTEKGELLAAARRAVAALRERQGATAKYDLLANICHDSPVEAVSSDEQMTLEKGKGTTCLSGG